MILHLISVNCNRLFPCSQALILLEGPKKEWPVPTNLNPMNTAADRSFASPLDSKQNCVRQGAAMRFFS